MLSGDDWGSDTEVWNIYPMSAVESMHVGRGRLMKLFVMGCL
jgi:hypothetical protein